MSRHQPCLLTLTSCALTVVLSGCGVVASTAPTPMAADATSPSQAIERGRRAFQGGDFERAITDWRDAAESYRRAKDRREAEALLHLAEAYRAIAHYRDALEALDRALWLAREAQDGTGAARALAALGATHAATGATELAITHLNESLSLAQASGETVVTARVLNDLANLHADAGRDSDALLAYDRAAIVARTAGRGALAARAFLNSAAVLRRSGSLSLARAQLDAARRELQTVRPSHETAYTIIAVALGYGDLHRESDDADGVAVRTAAVLLRDAGTMAERLRDGRAASYAWGHLGALYEQEQRHGEALELTRQAVLAAQGVNAPESLYRWQWQSGRLLGALGQDEEAIAAYRRAVMTLQGIRPELANAYRDRGESFRDSVGALYFQLVDLLLRRSAAATDPVAVRQLLEEARETVEVFKVAELRDYFRDDCVEIARSRIAKLDAVSPAAVVIYPILLPDRTELLVTLPTGLKRFSVPIGAETVTGEVREFRQLIDKPFTGEYLAHAQRLYDWLIRPIEAELAAVNADTLVMVPDGPLRTIPLAALHDGRQFLVRKYAVAVTPGLKVTDPRPIRRDDARVLAVGLTEAVQGLPALPAVAAELEAIAGTFSGTTLVNRDFVASRLERALREERFSILHVASHAQFGGTVDSTFVVTFDGKVTLDQLERYIGLLKFRDEPLELLVLSACETAAGDDRAALGLAGVAIKAGARSALATLWAINDESSAELIAEFYRQLQQPGVSRAAALRSAQSRFLDDPRYGHPAYWAAFLLINNWL